MTTDPDPQDCNDDAVTPVKTDEYTDGRKLWEWESKYSKEAQKAINHEAMILVFGLAISLVITGFFLGLGDTSFQFSFKIGDTEQALFISCKLIGTFFTGCVGGITFSIKWLVHTAATGKWHLDRRYWRLLVPWIGGVYALVMLALFDAGLFARANGGDSGNSALAPALAFLVGYFSDGVSGLLSNIANAVFGTLEKK